ncbi:transcriptional regulator, partial [Streptomyces sp. NPDC005271]
QNPSTRFIVPAQKALSHYRTEPGLAPSEIARLGDELPDGGVVVLGDLASALLRGGDVDQGVYVSRQFATAAQAKPNTMGKERAETIAASLPDRERELAVYLRQCAS